jgi:hypothetical protein
MVNLLIQAQHELDAVRHHGMNEGGEYAGRSKQLLYLPATIWQRLVTL